MHGDQHAVHLHSCLSKLHDYFLAVLGPSYLESKSEEGVMSKLAQCQGFASISPVATKGLGNYSQNSVPR